MNWWQKVRKASGDDQELESGVVAAARLTVEIDDCRQRMSLLAEQRSEVIRRLVNSGVSQTAVADAMGVSRQLVSKLYWRGHGNEGDAGGD